MGSLFRQPSGSASYFLCVQMTLHEIWPTGLFVHICKRRYKYHWGKFSYSFSLGILAIFQWQTSSLCGNFKPIHVTLHNVAAYSQRLTRKAELYDPETILSGCSDLMKFESRCEGKIAHFHWEEKENCFQK